MQNHSIWFVAYRADAVSAQAKSPTAQQGAPIRFIAGGTNLVDYMKLNVEVPRQLIDINALPLDRIELTSDGGMKIGALARNSVVAHDERVKQRYPVLSTRAIAGIALPRSCGTWPPLRAISCRRRVASTTAIRLTDATSAARYRLLRPLAVITVCWRSWARATSASPPILLTRTLPSLALDATVHIDGSKGESCADRAVLFTLPGYNPRT